MTDGRWNTNLKGNSSSSSLKTGSESGFIWLFSTIVFPVVSNMSPGLRSLLSSSILPEYIGSLLPAQEQRAKTKVSKR